MHLSATSHRTRLSQIQAVPRLGSPTGPAVLSCATQARWVVRHRRQAIERESLCHLGHRRTMLCRHHRQI